ncbi:esterase-like activity of phytase family protein [Roseobacter weihaiensis]|uniref:esterase-like activity of phytase family protein n=1 Tax=Roseobacter weihaiensis TaxID=2763262 RepID=UPI001D0B664D|nr:esterase-like activity of phytase family protein [Roseobacter sp. H9]
MRHRLAVALIAAVGAGAWFWFKPPAPPPGLPAELGAVVDIAHDAAWFGGLSGLEVTPGGSGFYAITDRGHILRGSLTRQGQELLGARVERGQPFVDAQGQTQEFPYSDAEGLALDATGGLYVSFEHAHRVLFYQTWESPAQQSGYTRAWRALPENGGLEALAVAPDGRLLALPEKIARGATEALIYERAPTATWMQNTTLPVDPMFSPVGADFGPDGRLYVLERGVYPFAFFNRVRAMTLTPAGVTDIELILQTGLGDYGNLEGLSVWQDAEGLIRLTMVSDDNFLWFLPSQIVEYTLPDRVALAPQ